MSIVKMPEVRGQKTEIGRQKTEDRNKGSPFHCHVFLALNNSVTNLNHFKN